MQERDTAGVVRLNGGLATAVPICGGPDAGRFPRTELKLDSRLSCRSRAHYRQNHFRIGKLAEDDETTPSADRPASFRGIASGSAEMKPYPRRSSSGKVCRPLRSDILRTPRMSTSAATGRGEKYFLPVADHPGRNRRDGAQARPQRDLKAEILRPLCERHVRRGDYETDLRRADPALRR